MLYEVITVGLYSFSSNQKFPNNRNMIFDLSTFFKTIDQTYEPINYRYRAGFLIQNVLFSSINYFPRNNFV